MKKKNDDIRQFPDPFKLFNANQHIELSQNLHPTERKIINRQGVDKFIRVRQDIYKAIYLVLKHNYRDNKNIPDFLTEVSMFNDVFPRKINTKFLQDIIEKSDT